MSPKVQLRLRMKVVLHMVMAFVVAILLAQLWLFSIALEAMESRDASLSIVAVTLACSLLACVAIWSLIRFFLRTESQIQNHSS